jgi:hypothetical protein
LLDHIDGEGTYSNGDIAVTIASYEVGLNGQPAKYSAIGMLRDDSGQFQELILADASVTVDLPANSEIEQAGYRLATRRALRKGETFKCYAVSGKGLFSLDKVSVGDRETPSIIIYRITTDGTAKAVEPTFIVYLWSRAVREMVSVR